MLKLVYILFALTVSFSLHAEKWDGLPPFSCESALTSKVAPPPGDKPLQVGFWSSVGSFIAGNFKALKEYSESRAAFFEYLKRLEAFEYYQRNLQQAQDEARSELNRLLAKAVDGRLLDPTLTGAAIELQLKGEELIKLSITVDQVREVVDYVSLTFAKLKEFSSALSKEKRSAFSKIEASEAKVARIREEERAQVTKLIEWSRDQIWSIKSLGEIQAITEQVELQIALIGEEFDRVELQRRQKELRFDILESGNSNQILGAISSLGFGPIPSGLDSAMEQSASLKRFVYRELQATRRLNVPEYRNGLTARWQNNWKVIADASIGDPIAVLKEMRRSLARFRPEEIRRLNLLEREQIITHALKRDELKVMLLHMNLQLQAGIAPPAPPDRPSENPPVAPRFPRKARDRAHYNQLKKQGETYKRDVQKWRESWERYKVLVERYRTKDWPTYIEELGKLRDAHIRRSLARRHFLVYLIYFKPEVFNKPEVSSKLAKKYRKEAEKKKSAKAEEEARQRAQEDDSGLGVFDFYMYLYTENPWWLVNRDIAWMMYFFDSAKYHTGPALPSFSDFGFTTGPTEIPSGWTTENLEPTLNATDVPEFSTGGGIGKELLALPEFKGAEFLTPDLPDMTALAPSIPDLPEVSIPDLPQISIPDPPAVSSSSYESSYSSSSYGSGGSSGGDGGGGGGGD